MPKTELGDVFNANMYGPYVFTLFVNRGSNVNEEVKRNFKETLDCLSKCVGQYLLIFAEQYCRFRTRDRCSRYVK